MQDARGTRFRSSAASHPNGDIADQAVTGNRNAAVTPALGHRRYLVGEVASQHAPTELDVGSRADEHVDITKDRVGLDVNLGWSALRVRQIDRHVAKQGDGDELLLNVPASRALAFATAFEDRI